MIKYLELDKETLDIVSGPWTAFAVPVFSADLNLIAKEVVSMPDEGIILGQVWNDATSSVEDTQVSLNNKGRLYLAKTDWYVIRNIEAGTAIPTDVSDKRTQSRLAIVE